ncbi:YbaY family lipoprotein [Novosphingobium sp. ZN18A2]|uniref:YbaY family lipoprotein n=1 Tax=Novosphingobium sp. ZN18A2 TaxID=3079861 RepID=UPI0030CAF751
MKKPLPASILAGSMLAVSVLVSGCAMPARQAEPQAPLAKLHDMKISGQAAYRERIALAPGSTFDVRLIDISRADAPADVLAQESRVLNGEQVPLPFTLSVSEHKIKTNRRYAVRATITDPQGRLAWTSDRVYPVGTSAYEQDLGTIALVRVRSSGGSDPARPASTQAIPSGAVHTVEDIDGTGLIDNSHVTILFGTDGRVSGSTGCNTFSASYTANGNALSIGPVATTRRACLPALDKQQARFLEAMQSLSQWSLDPQGRLVLRGANGHVIVAIRS